MAGAIAIMLYMQLPRAAFESMRAKEELLIDRAEQYQRAIQLYVAATKQYPQSMDQLEKVGQRRFLRKKFKDPFTGKDEWRLIHADAAGNLIDSLVQKKDEKKENQNRFISESAAMGAPATGPGQTGVNVAFRRRPSDGPIEEGSGGGLPPPPEAPPPPAPSPFEPVGNQQQQQQPIAPPGQAQAPGFVQQQSGQVGQAGMQPQPGFPPQQQPGFPQQQPAFPQQQQPGFPQQQPGFPQQQQPAFPQQQPAFPQQQPAFPQQQPGFPQQQQPAFPQQQPAFPQQQQPGFPQGMQQQQTFIGGGQAAPQPFGVQGGMIGQQQQPTFPTSAATQAGRPDMTGAVPGGGNNAALDMIRRALTSPTQGMAMGGQGMQLGGGMVGVASKHEGPSIKIYNEQQEYHKWEFIYDPKKDKRLLGQLGLQAGAQGNMPQGQVPNPLMNPGQQGSNPMGSGMTPPPSAFGSNSMTGPPVPFGGSRGFAGQPGTGSYPPPGGFGQQTAPGGFGQQRPPGGFGQQQIPGGFGQQQPPGGSGQQQPPGGTGQQSPGGYPPPSGFPSPNRR